MLFMEKQDGSLTPRIRTNDLRHKRLAMMALDNETRIHIIQQMPLKLNMALLLQCLVNSKTELKVSTVKMPRFSLYERKCISSKLTMRIFVERYIKLILNRFLQLLSNSILKLE